MRAAVVVLAGILLAGVVAVAPCGADEQMIQPLSPGVEQRVQPLGGDQQVEAIQGVDDQHIETVERKDPPSPVVRVASTAGKVVLGVVAAGVGVGTMVASLLFI